SSGSSCRPLTATGPTTRTATPACFPPSSSARRRWSAWAEFGSAYSWGNSTKCRSCLYTPRPGRRRVPMAENATPPPHDESAHADYTNPEVRYERSDVAPRAVVTFIAAVGAMVLLSGTILVWLFRSYEGHAAAANAREVLPLARGEREALPVTPRLEGINP